MRRVNTCPLEQGDAAQRASTDARPLWTALVLALALTLAFDMLPRAPLDNTFDPSWAAVLSYAHEKNLQFGTEIVFTYGPLGFAANPYFTPAAAGLRLVLTTGFSFLVTAGVCLWARRLHWFGRALLLCCFVFSAANVFRQAELCYQTGLLCWGLLCLSECGRALRLSLLGCALLAIFGFLAKFTFLFAAAVTLLAVVVCLWLRKDRALAIGGGLAFLAGSVLGWVLLGQGLGHLLPYLRSGFAMASGYGPSMFYEPPLGPWRRAVVVALLGAGSVVAIGFAAARVGKHSPSGPGQSAQEPDPPLTTGATRTRGELLVLVCWLETLLFLAWKYGAIIPDREHLQVFFGFMAVLVLALHGLPLSSSGARFWGWMVAAVSLFISLTTLQFLLPSGPGHSLAHPFRMTPLNLKALLQPSHHVAELSAACQEQRAREALPNLRTTLGQARVDVFGSHSSFALVNELNYSPRPVFQSYAAYSEPLMRLNEGYYLSERAPPYVLFELAPLTRRLPALEDSLVLRHLLINYRPIQAEGPFILLGSNACDRPKLTLLKAGHARIGEPVSLAGFGATNLWMEIEVPPSWQGQVRDFAWQSARLRVGVWLGGRRVRTFRTPGPMLAAGFLASPLLLRTEDVADLYDGKASARPDAYSVEVNPGTQYLWASEFHFRLYAIANRLGAQ